MSQAILPCIHVDREIICCDGTNQRNQQVLTENIFNIQHSTLGKIQYSFTYKTNNDKNKQYDYDELYDILTHYIKLIAEF